MDTDFLLIQKMRLGDESAIDAFVEKYYSRILRYCRSHITDADYAEDLTQETFVRFFRTLPSYRHYGKAANYLYVIAANVCNDYYRKNDAGNKKEIPLEELAESPEELLAQFFLPCSVTCCICFCTLYSRKMGSEAFALLACGAWYILWNLAVLDEKIYGAISPSACLAVTIAAVFYTGYCIFRGQGQLPYRIWEENRYGTETD